MRAAHWDRLRGNGRRALAKRVAQEDERGTDIEKTGFISMRDDGDNESQQISRVNADSGIRPQIKPSMNWGRKTNTLLAS